MSDQVGEVSQAYHVDVGGSIVPAGYKQTEVGVIAEDWEVYELGQLIRLTEYGSSAKSVSSGKVPVLRMGNLQGGEVEWDDLVFTSNPHEIAKYKLDKYDVLFNRTNTADLVGKTAIFKGDREAIFAGYLIRVKTNNDLLNPQYLNYILNTRQAKEYSKKVLSVGVSQANINAEKLKTYKIPIPPKLDEQTAIANALSDADALISEQEKLIAKKQAIKTATMQQLLTGRTRLPPFALREDGSQKGYKQSELGEVPEDWGVVPLTTFISGLIAGVSVNSIDEPDSYLKPAAVLKTSCVHSGKFLHREAKTIESRDLNRAKCLVKKGSLIISRMNTPGLVGECGYVDRDFDNLFLPDRLWQTIFYKEYENVGLWLSHLLSYPLYSKMIKDLATGTSNSMKNIAKDSILALLVASPCVEEQIAIANYVTDMDEEIQTLQHRLAKTQQIKQGMMQELLTGRTRLI